MNTERRFFLAGSGAVLLSGWSMGCARAAPRAYEFTLPDAEWRKRLTAAQYATLRKGATDYAFRSPYLEEHRAGIFSCAGCALPLYSSRTKFDSGTGWPSFWASLPRAVLTNTDRTLGMVRDELVCRRCGGHLGHVFDDGPAPTGKRHCINGTALNFTPRKAA